MIPIYASTMEAQFNAFTQGLSSLIYGSMAQMVTSLLLVAIAIAVVKRMFVFGDTQTLAAANKIILTAFIGALVMMIIYPLTNVLEERFESSTSQIQIDDSGQSLLDKDAEYSGMAEAFENIADIAEGARNTIFGVLVALALISVGVSALRIKFSLGNPEIIAESKKFIKITIVSVIIMWASVGIIDWMVNYFNDGHNPIAASIGEVTSDLLGDDDFSWSFQSSEQRNAASELGKVDPAQYPGAVVVSTFNSQTDRPRIQSANVRDRRDEFVVTPNLNQGYKFYIQNNEEDRISFAPEGESPITAFEKNIVIWVLVNQGYRAVVTTDVGGSHEIRVPRIEESGSPLENLQVRASSDVLNKDKTELQEGVDYVKIGKDDNLPEPAPNFVGAMWSTMAGPADIIGYTHWHFLNRVKVTWEYYRAVNVENARFYYIGGLKWGTPLSPSEYRYVDVTFFRDTEEQKSFSKVDLHERDEDVLVPGFEETDHDYYILTSDITKSISRPDKLPFTKDELGFDLSVFQNSEEKTVEPKIFDSSRHDGNVAFHNFTRLRRIFLDQLAKVNQAPLPDTPPPPEQ